MIMIMPRIVAVPMRMAHSAQDARRTFLQHLHHSAFNAPATRSPGTGRLVPGLDGRHSVRFNLPLVDPDRAGDGWSVLADATRRAIVSRLAEGPLAVGQLAAGLPVSRPAVSQHLKVLKDAGLVSERAAGTRRVYRLNPVAVAALRDQLDTFWQRALAGYADVAEQATEESS
jgi:DNA-binding transcriptional ArsR family regulator